MNRSKRTPLSFALVIVNLRHAWRRQTSSKDWAVLRWPTDPIIFLPTASAKNAHSDRRHAIANPEVDWEWTK